MKNFSLARSASKSILGIIGLAMAAFANAGYWQVVEQYQASDPVITPATNIVPLGDMDITGCGITGISSMAVAAGTDATYGSGMFPYCEQESRWVHTGGRNGYTNVFGSGQARIHYRMKFVPEQSSDVIADNQYTATIYGYFYMRSTIAAGINATTFVRYDLTTIFNDASSLAILSGTLPGGDRLEWPAGNALGTRLLYSMPYRFVSGVVGAGGLTRETKNGTETIYLDAEILVPIDLVASCFTIATTAFNASATLTCDAIERKVLVEALGYKIHPL